MVNTDGKFQTLEELVGWFMTEDKKDVKKISGEQASVFFDLVARQLRKELNQIMANDTLKTCEIAWHAVIERQLKALVCIKQAYFALRESGFIKGDDVLDFNAATVV